jgi:hypothetical protein
MTIRTRLAATAVGAAVGVTVALASPTTAHAVQIGGQGSEPRCNNHPTAILCLYFSSNADGFNQGWWGHGFDADNQDDDLGGDRFFSGTGLGAGQIVRNRAAKMACFISASQCRSYVFVNQGGDFDWTLGGWRGALIDTWNDEASTWIL